MTTVDVIHKYATQKNLSDSVKHSMLAPLRIANKIGFKDINSTMNNLDLVVAAVTKEYPNPRTSRNYINGLKMVLQVPEVRQALGAQQISGMDRKLQAELSDLNHASYQLARRSEIETPQQEVERLRKENEILRKMLGAIHSLTSGIQ